MSNTIADALGIVDADPEGNIVSPLVRRYVYLGPDLNFAKSDLIVEIIKGLGMEPTDDNKQLALQMFAWGQFAERLLNRQKKARNL